MQTFITYGVGEHLLLGYAGQLLFKLVENKLILIRMTAR